jgi:Zn-dependent protease
MDTNAFRTIILSIIPFLLAITVHEVAHGYVAYRKGDYTAKLMGRITMNPIKHLDPFGSLIFPLLLAFSGAGVIFGWAKPVPVNAFNFKDRRRDMMLVGLAGPVSNFLLAAALAFVFRILMVFPGEELLFSSKIGQPIAIMLVLAIKISIYLGVFNLLPIHPLDGSHVLEGLLPPEQAQAYSRLEKYGFIFLIILLFTGILTAVTYPVYAFILRIISTIFGI